MKKTLKRKVFVVGDIHGCFLEFLSLIERAYKEEEELRLILLGDLINRGPCSMEMLEWIRWKGAEIVRGNHEQKFIDEIKEDLPLSPILKQLKDNMGGKLNDWIDWLSSLPYYIEEKDFLAVHGGLVPGENPKDSDPRLLMNIRTWDGKGEDIKNTHKPPLPTPWFSFYRGEKLVLYGHWAKRGLEIRPNSIGLDSGCVYGGKLSGIILPDRKLLQTPALCKYTDPN